MTGVVLAMTRRAAAPPKSPDPETCGHPRNRKAKVTRKQFDDAFPTIVRYAGVVLMAVLVGSAAFGHIDYPAGFVAALGMILYKNVHNAGNGNGGGK